MYCTPTAVCPLLYVASLPGCLLVGSAGTERTFLSPLPLRLYGLGTGLVQCMYICTYHDVSEHFPHRTLYYTCLHTVHVCVHTCMLMPSGAPESSGGRVPSGAGPAPLHQCHSQYCDGTAQVPERGDWCGTRAVQGQQHTV